MRPADEIEAGLLLLAFCLPLSVALTNLTLAALTLAVLARLLKGRIMWQERWNGPMFALLAYCGAALLVCVFAVDPSRSVHYALKDWHKPWALGVMLLAFSSKPKMRAARALAVGFCAASLVGIWQWDAGVLVWGLKVHPRAHAFVHPVSFGEMLAAAALGGLCFLGRAEAGIDGKLARLAAAAFVLLSLITLALNQTRGAILGLAVGYAAACALDRRLRRWAWPVVALVAAAAAVSDSLPNSRHALRALAHFQLRGPDGAFNQAFTRYELWDVAWRMLKDHPLTGVGPGNYNIVFTRYFQGTLENQRVWGSAHNLYLQQLAERGLVGFAALACALGTLTGQAYRRARADLNSWSLWAWCAMVAFLAMNLTEVAFQNELVATLFLFIWAQAEANSEIPAGKVL